jgi:RNA recognition motif-containing protein
LSNLPKNINEAELNAIFLGYRVVSSKILRDSMGNSRGVGFARFETRAECEAIIKKYHGAPIGVEGLLMQVRYADNQAQKLLKRAPEYRAYLEQKELMKQVRYADTPAQKELKRVTAERRQFRTNEYNIGAYGTADVGIHPSIYHQGSWSRRITSGTSANFAPRTFGGSSVEGSSFSGVSPGARSYAAKYGANFHEPSPLGRHAEHDY